MAFYQAPELHSSFEECFHATRTLWKNFATVINCDEIIFFRATITLRLGMLHDRFKDLAKVNKHFLNILLRAKVIIWFVTHNLTLLYVHEDRDVTKQ